MAAAIVDLDINEGDTFVMDLELWENEEETIPIDVTGHTFSGAFQIGTKYIPMTITHALPAVNVISITVPYTDMANLSSKGKYDIDQLIGTEKFRLLQGKVRVSAEVTT